MAATVALAALFPARGAFADVMSVAAKVVIALLFWLYGARLSPQQAWQGVKRWQLHLLVLATTFVVFPVLGLAARGLVPWLLNLDLYNGLLFLCLVPSTVQSSIAFTSIARGNVSAALVSASLSNIVGVALTPLLVVLLMNTSGGARMDATAIRDVVLQLLLPFVVGQLMRPWIADWVAPARGVDQARRPRVDPVGRLHRVLDGHGGTHLAQRRSVATGHRRGRQHACCWPWCWRFTWLIGRLVGLDRGDSIVLLFCGSKKSLASGLPMALVFFPGRHCRRDHVAADDLSPDPAGGVLGDRQQAVPRRTARGGGCLVAADVDRVGGQHRQRLRLTSQHPAPQIHPRLDQNVRRQRRQHNPVVALDLALELTDRPA